MPDRGPDRAPRLVSQAFTAHRGAAALKGCATRAGTAALIACAIGAALLALLIAVGNAQTIAIASIHGYQRTLSPVAARLGLRCRFTPTCSRYAETVIARDGVVRGGARALARIARCGPWTPQGTRDEP